MDYLRQVAGSREGAKEVKLFGLNKYFTDRFQTIANQIYRRTSRSPARSSSSAVCSASSVPLATTVRMST